MMELLSLLWTPHGNCVFAIAPLLLAGIMAAANYGKSELVDKPQAEKKRQTEAELTRWSPWTGIKGQTVYDPNSADAAIQGGFQGYSLGQNIDSNNEEKALRKALLDDMRWRNWNANMGNNIYAGTAPGPYAPTENK